jgi:hypothetical protein
VGVENDFEKFNQATKVKARVNAQAVAVALEIVPLVHVDAYVNKGRARRHIRRHVACIHEQTAFERAPSFHNKNAVCAPTVSLVGHNLVKKGLLHRTALVPLPREGPIDLLLDKDQVIVVEPALLKVRHQSIGLYQVFEHVDGSLFVLKYGRGGGQGSGKDVQLQRRRAGFGKGCAGYSEGGEGWG